MIFHSKIVGRKKAGYTKARHFRLGQRGCQMDSPEISKGGADPEIRNSAYPQNGSKLTTRIYKFKFKFEFGIYTGIWQILWTNAGHNAGH
jgi:hypothetical protein